MKILACAMKILLKPIFYCLSQASYLHEFEQKGSRCTEIFLTIPWILRKFSRFWTLKENDIFQGETFWLYLLDSGVSTPSRGPPERPECQLWEKARVATESSGDLLGLHRGSDRGFLRPPSPCPQVWSITQFYSVSFLKSRKIVRTFFEQTHN